MSKMPHLKSINQDSFHCRDIIKYGSCRDIPFLATSTRDATLTSSSVNHWLHETSNNLINRVIPESFWKSLQLPVPELPLQLRTENWKRDESQTFLLVIIWCYLSEEIRKLIFDCMKSGMHSWETSEMFWDEDWIKMYAGCVMQYLTYAEKLVDSSMCQEPEENNLLLNQAMFTLPVIFSTSKLFEIVTDRGTNRKVTDEFFKILFESNPKRSSLPTPISNVSSTMLCSVPKEVNLISMLDVFKVTYFIPSLRKYFKVESFKHLAKVIHYLLRKEIRDDKLFNDALDKECQEATKSLKISTEENPKLKAHLIVFVKLVSDFIQFSEHEVVTEKEVLVMKMLYPSYKCREGEDTESKLKRIMENKDAPLLPDDFVAEMIQSRFKLPHVKWHFYYNFGMNHSLGGNQGPKVEKVKGKRKELIPAKPRLRFSLKKKANEKYTPAKMEGVRMGTRANPSIEGDENFDTKLDSNSPKDDVSVSSEEDIPISKLKQVEHRQPLKESVKLSLNKKGKEKITLPKKRTRMATRSNSTVKIQAGFEDKLKLESNMHPLKKKIGQEKFQAPKGKCSYENCCLDNETLKSCYHCREFNIHSQCHENFFAKKTTRQSDDEPAIQYCWDCSMETPGSKRKKMPRRP